MGNIKDLFNSAAYKAFMKKLFIYALIILIIGIVFLLFKWHGGNILTIVGGATLVILALFTLLGKIVG